ncbi:MAG: transglycosylase domain-containing protein [Erysipelotrichaceae bacterium]|nr:transglycosylase domain-containing protein [Erysipelotrichaceae bacterium]
MLKKLKRIVIVLFLTLSVLAGIVFTFGFRLYREKIESTPLQAAVEPYITSSRYSAFDEIDPDFVNAVVSIEDKRFFTRDGYDWIALFRAIINNYRAKGFVEGGSTIGEQVAKNLYFYGEERGLLEKIAEVFLMNAIENEYSKEDVFALYASMNYYGDGYWGLKEAAGGYFDKDTNDLTIPEAAMLAGIPNAPAIFQLSTGFDKAKAREEKILKKMFDNGYIDEATLQESLAYDFSDYVFEK